MTEGTLPTYTCPAATWADSFRRAAVLRSAEQAAMLTDGPQRIVDEHGAELKTVYPAQLADVQATINVVADNPLRQIACDRCGQVAAFVNRKLDEAWCSWCAEKWGADDSGSDVQYLDDGYFVARDRPPTV